MAEEARGESKPAGVREGARDERREVPTAKKTGKSEVHTLARPVYRPNTAYDTS